MKYHVASGEYTTVIDRKTPEEAARDALSLLRYKVKKFTLSKVTTVTDKKGVDFFLWTSSQLQIIGMEDYAS